MYHGLYFTEDELKAAYQVLLEGRHSFSNYPEMESVIDKFERINTELKL